LVKVFVVLGLALLAGGAYAIVDGWAYVVLERGFTEVILGALAVTAGLILLALAAVLAEVRRLKGLVSGAMAVVALSEPRSIERPAPNEAPARPEPALERERGLEAGHIGIATTLAAGAGAAAVGGALASLAKADEPADEKASDKPEEADKPEGDDAAEDKQTGHVGVVAAEPQQSLSTATGAIDDWLLPPLPAALDAAPSEFKPDEQDEAEEEPTALEGEQGPPISADIAEPSRPNPDDDEESVKAEPVQVSAEETEAEQVKAEADIAEPEAVPEPDEERLWWPRIDRPSIEAAASVDDEFTALRDQLSGVINAPEVELPRRDRLGASDDTAETWMAPRAWPPVTQPRDPGALGDVEADTAGKVSTGDAAAETAATGEPAVPEPELEEEPRQLPVSAEAEVPPAETAETAAEAKPDEAPPGEEPAASEEGVIGAYQVGETQFTMFADGSIHARTPDGDYTFASMDELKTYLASEKDKLEPAP